jgi:galactose mutarotase-like enzyme
MPLIQVGSYKDVECIILENDVLRVTMLPHYGSKLASLVYKPLDMDVIWQPEREEFRKTGYGASFLEGDFSGFDEMFPTISSCYYEREPWDGVFLPDHGEVWGLPWDYNQEQESVHLIVHGVVLPYRLEKWIRLKDYTVSIRYKATNLSPFEMDYIWSAHALFVANPSMEFVVPEGMDTIVNSVPGPRMGGYGEQFSFPKDTLPQTELGKGEVFDFSRVPPYNGKGYQKYFFKGPVSQGWWLLYDHEKKVNIGMSYPKEQVPYLGMWLNEGGLEGQYNIAPEPATGGMDRIDFAKMWGVNSVLAPNGDQEWFLNISVQQGEKAQSIDAGGAFL